MAQSPGKVAAALMAQSAAALVTAQKPTLDAAAMEAKKAVLAELDKVTSGRKLRNVGKKGAKLGVNFKVTGDTATVKATGPWQIIERNTGPHRINRKSKDKRRALKLPNGYRRSVPHPGTTGKHPWEKGAKVADDKVPKVMADRYMKAVDNVW